jgi:kynureninase
MRGRHTAVALDAADPLAKLRAQFALDPNTIYLAGNLLGVPPAAAAQCAQVTIAAEWREGLIRSWRDAGWFTLTRRLGDKLAPLIGAAHNEVVIADSSSLNLFKLLSAALRMQQRDPKRRVIVAERGDFPGNLYIAHGLLGQFDRSFELRLMDDPSDLAAALRPDTAVAMMTHVNHRSGAMHDIAALTQRIHQCGALAVWDLANSVGVVPIDLNAAGADGAVGCTYKYLNGGPGAPGFVWVPQRHQRVFEQPLSGWWGHRAPFEMDPTYEPEDGIGRFLCATQPIVSMALIESGLDVLLQTDMETVRTKSLGLTDLFIELVETRCGGFPLRLVTPREHTKRGSQLSFAYPEARRVMESLKARGVLCDYREPDILRFGFAPLYTRYVDVWDAVDSFYAELVRQSGAQFSADVRPGCV